MNIKHQNRLHHLSWLDGVELLHASFHGQLFGKHSHDAYAIGVMEGGVGGNFYRGTKQVLPPRTLSLMNPDEPHDGYAISESLQYKMLYVSESAMRHLLGRNDLQGFHEYTANDDGNAVRFLLNDVHRRLEQKHHAGWRLAVDSALTVLLELIMQQHARNVVRPARCEPDAVRLVKEYLDSLATATRDPEASYCDDSITLDHLASLVDLKRNYLLNVFSQHVGVPPYMYWMARRIDSAKILLAAGCSVSDVAHRLGFYDQSHFLRSFKRFTGVTPRQFVGH
ncbi:AraC family transcriptional regulator [Aromatoleum toluclasticum]|uniref:AraC family transcriptional regulator n=1 Tax=Aromatoleum toluclasticum TaxID=92003 RepID=UPI001D1937BA|nr:AraC family transcriptional regulator [Aromatoleum toluclasticum]MCC4113750.1 AraC family transcriptional regulator [Aromatoleum toluclasticum]